MIKDTFPILGEAYELKEYYRRPYENRKLSNAYSENINGKIRTYITASRALGNFKRFRCRTLFALNPRIYFAIPDNLKTRGLDEREVHTTKNSNLKGFRACFNYSISSYKDYC